MDPADEEANDTDIDNKQKGEEREDRARNVERSHIKAEVKVLLRNTVMPYKLTPAFGNEEYEVVQREGNELTLSLGDKTTKRHLAHVKKITESGVASLSMISQSQRATGKEQRQKTEKNGRNVAAGSRY